MIHPVMIAGARLLNMIVNLHSIIADGDVCEALVDPGSAIEIIDSVFVLVKAA